ncbi:hypothetical protein K8I85_05565 [bacterium]|nr:hypothetical protein [bacterium]
MITLTGFLHRAELRELLGRWLAGDDRPGDAGRVKELVNFNSVAIRQVREHLAAVLLPAVYGKAPTAVPVHTKGVVKDLLVRAPALTRGPGQARIRECLDRYARRPELFYRDTPVEGVAYLDATTEQLLATGRIKRVRRISDKCSRRILETLGKHMEERDAPDPDDVERVALAWLRSIPPDEPVTTPIHDVLGFKLLGGDPVRKRLLRWIDARGDLQVVRRKDHRGTFHATNLVVQWRPPWEKIVSVTPRPQTQAVLRARGMQGDLSGRFRQFILSGEESVNLELIVQGYADAMESEIGRSLHEDRVFRQRMARESWGSIAPTIAALTRYLFYFALSRQTVLPEVPLRLSERYMPDRLEQVFLSLTDFPAGDLGLVP